MFTKDSPSAPRLRQSFEQGWRFHQGEIGHMPRQGTKAAGLGGLTNLLKDEKPQNGANREWEAMIEKLATIPSMQFFFADPVPADKETGWIDVCLPHDWKIDLPFTNDTKTYGPTLPTQGYKPSGVGYYRKLFTFPAEWEGRKIAIEFDGIMGESTVWINGVCLGEHWNGYTSFSCDLTDILNYGEEGQNVILIRVDSTDAQGWWYEGAGIYRHVWLTVTGRLHVDKWGTFITTPQIEPAETLVRVQTTVKNDWAEMRHFELKTTLLDPDGHPAAEVASLMEIQGLEKGTCIQELQLVVLRLWSLETPELYRAVIEIHWDGSLADRTTTSFGIRKIEYTRQGLFINGKHVVIKGACVHQDHAGVGIAMPDRLIEFRLEKLKEAGCNAYRSAHHPPTPELLDFSDRLGILVLDENRVLESTEYGLVELESMILRDRNHPSVFMWSLSNEESVAGTPKGRRLYRAMVDQARKLDPTRLLTSATSGGKEDAAYIDIADVAGYNYAPNNQQYGLARKHFEQYPNRRFLGTEDACAFTTRGIYVDDPQRGWCSSFGSEATLLGPVHPAEGVDLSQFLDIGALAQPEKTWQHYLENPFMGGVFIWTGFDYRGEAGPWYWPQMMHQGGIYDLCGFEKDATYFYKAIWNDEPIVHLMPHWDWPDLVGQEIRVRVYTNCDEVELVLNSQSLGRWPRDNVAQVNCKIPYSPGILEARGYKEGHLVASDRKETTGNSTTLRITPDWDHISANGGDLSMVKVEILDNKGRLVPIACPELTFTVSGPAILLGVGNGDPADHDPDRGPHRKAFNGRALVLIQTIGEAGKIILKVEGSGLTPTETVITAEG
jgi:beta-galactosidase